MAVSVLLGTRGTRRVPTWLRKSGRARGAVPSRHDSDSAGAPVPPTLLRRGRRCGWEKQAAPGLRARGMEPGHVGLTRGFPAPQAGQQQPRASASWPHLPTRGRFPGAAPPAGDKPSLELDGCLGLGGAFVGRKSVSPMSKTEALVDQVAVGRCLVQAGHRPTHKHHNNDTSTATLARVDPAHERTRSPWTSALGETRGKPTPGQRPATTQWDGWTHPTPVSRAGCWLALGCPAGSTQSSQGQLTHSRRVPQGPLPGTRPRQRATAEPCGGWAVGAAGTGRQRMTED